MCIFLILPVYNVHNAYVCKLRKELPPVNLAAVTCDSCSGMTGKLVPGSIIVCSMGSRTARGVKITGVCRSPPLPDGVGRRRQAALSGLPHSAARRQFFLAPTVPILYRWITKSSVSISKIVSSYSRYPILTNSSWITRWHGKALNITGPLWGGSTSHWLIPLTMGQQCEDFGISSMSGYIALRSQVWETHLDMAMWWSSCIFDAVCFAVVASG